MKADGSGADRMRPRFPLPISGTTLAWLAIAAILLIIGVRLVSQNPVGARKIRLRNPSSIPPPPPSGEFQGAVTARTIRDPARAQEAATAAELSVLFQSEQLWRPVKSQEEKRPTNTDARRQ